MITRRNALFLAVAAIGLPTFAGRAAAYESTPFDRSAFDAAVKSGKPVLVDISATWCTTCHQQHTVLDRLFGEAKFAGFMVFGIDYDTQKDVMRSFGVQQRATLIAFRSGAEVGRLSWETSEPAIAALLAKAT